MILALPPTDIDECGLGLDNCSMFAKCTNTIRSFECVCLPGFTGDGVTCVGNITIARTVSCNPLTVILALPTTDIDECAEGLACSSDAECINTPGSFMCVCLEGFTGDGFTCEGQ